MRTKIPVYTLLRSLGISNKKIIYSIGNKDDAGKINSVKSTKVYNALSEISELLFEKETNIVRLIKKQ